MKNRLTPAIALACTAALAALAAACSGDGDGPSATPTVPASPVATAEPAPSATATAGAVPTPAGTAIPVDPQPVVYEARAGGFVDVWTIDPNSGVATQLTDDGAVSGHPAWRPDYQRIIFSSNRVGRRSLWTMNPDGSDIQRLTDQPDADHWAPKYSPDGTQVTYIEVTDDAGSYLAVMNADGTGPRRLTGQYRFAEFPAWTRDGTQIFFAAIEEGRNNVDIYAVDLATLTVTTIVQTDGSDVCPHFSRDGNRLTYASSPIGEPENMDLFAREAPFDTHTDHGSDLRLTDDPGFDDYSNPSPDDDTYVFLSRRDGNTELYLMDRDGRNQRRLTFTPDVHENVPDW